MINPDEDGITHINVYSKGKTELGRMLSNFSKFPIHTKDGNFMSVEGYWYWMSIEDCPEREQLRKCYGFWAKKIGKEILEVKSKMFDTDFEHKILLAIWYKFRRNVNLILPEYSQLPFEHYYNYGGKVVDVKDKYHWMIDGITKMRDSLTNHKVSQGRHSCYYGRRLYEDVGLEGLSMVTVIKDNHITQCICENCKSVLEYALDDIKSENIRMNEVKQYIACPACGKKTETFIKPQISEGTVFG